jgi:sec-independent protein translocase protein TatC
VTKGEDQLTLVEHLDELRRRLFISVLALVAGMILAGVFNDQVFSLLVRPLPPSLKEITTFSPTEPFLVSLQVWLYSGIILASPLIIYEFWAYVGPAFTPGEKKHILPVAFICAVLFLGGVAFGYFLVLPRGLQVLLGWNSEFFNVQNRAKDYLSFVAWFLVAFGAVFEMPVIIVAAVRMGVVDRKFLRKNRKYAILINAAIAAIATPSQDAFSMLFMFVPLLFMYEIAIFISRFFEPQRRAARQAAQAQGGSP